MIRLPPFAPGQKIGLLGGSFDPPHDAHRAISLTALRRLGLDQVWWLVTPGNPLKPAARAPLPQRLAAARACAHHPRIVVTDIEAQLHTSYTVDTVIALLRRCANVRFVWLMGADNLAQFHRWKHWRDIAARLPIAVIDRPSARLAAFGSRAALGLARYRLPEPDATALPYRRPPAWVFLHGRKSPLSSTALRARSASGRG